MTEKDNEQITNVSSLIALCPKVENLPILKQLALKQHVSFHFEAMKQTYMYNTGKDSDKFATYVSLIESKPEYFGNVCDILVDEFVSEEVVEECLMYIRSGMVPYHLWINKLLSDIHDGSGFYNKQSIAGMVTVYLGRTLKASLIAFNKVIKVLEEEVDHLPVDVMDGVNFVKARALEIPQNMKEEYMKMFNADDEKARRKFQDNEITIFAETLVDMLDHPFDQEAVDNIISGNANPFTKFWVDPIGGGKKAPSMNMRDAGGVVAREGLGGQQQQEERTMGSWIEMLGYGPNGETPEEMQRMKEFAERQERIEGGLTEVSPETFHWENPEFRQFMTEYFGEDSDEEVSMYNGTYDAFDYDWDDDDIARLSNQWAEKARAAYLVEENEFFRTRAQQIQEDNVQVSNNNAVPMSNENVKYIVKKVAKDGSNRVMSQNWFDSESEAEQFVRDVTEGNPAMMSSFDFKIERGAVNGR